MRKGIISFYAVVVSQIYRCVRFRPGFSFSLTAYPVNDQQKNSEKGEGALEASRDVRFSEDRCGFFGLPHAQRHGFRLAHPRFAWLPTDLLVAPLPNETPFRAPGHQIQRCFFASLPEFVNKAGFAPTRYDSPHCKCIQLCFLGKVFVGSWSTLSRLELGADEGNIEIA